MHFATGIVSFFGFVLALGGYGLLSLLLLLKPWPQGSSRITQRAVAAAVAASAAWAAFTLVDGLSRPVWPGFVAAVFDVLRYGAWLALLNELQPRRSRRRVAAIATVLTIAAGLRLLPFVVPPSIAGAAVAQWQIAAWLSLPVLGLFMTEQFFRNLPDDLRWSAKPLCLAMICVFSFDAILMASALLMGALDNDAASIRGFAHFLCVPLLAVGMRRRASWLQSIRVSPKAAFYSATLLLSGTFLLLLASLGYYVRFFGGEWGRALQFALLFAGALGLSVLLLSSALRARVRVVVGKHFFSYRYDYREEWLRFTRMLSSHGAPQEVGNRVIRGLADMVESPAGALWTGADDGTALVQTVRWNVPETHEREATDSAFASFLRARGWVVDLEEYRQAPRRYGDLALPAWLLAAPNARLVVPLLVGDELLGFVVLSEPRTAITFNWELRDLLKTAGRQAAGFLAQVQATEALLEARKFDAFNRMSAFVVHDLKNIVTQLSLMLRNAKRLHDNPEFQQDMLLTVESSLEKMRRMMLQLREGQAPAGGTCGVELAPLAEKLRARAESQNRSVEVEIVERVSTRGHPDRLERILGHLVQNALEATTPPGRVRLKVARFSGQAQVMVADEGVGMSEEFMRTRLFRPFQTTKREGMGIGTYESQQYIRELGGTIEIESRPGQGTTVTLNLPLFDPQRETGMPLSSEN